MSLISDVRSTEAYVVQPPFPASGDRVQVLPAADVDGGSISPVLWSSDGKWLAGTWVSKSGETGGVGSYDVTARRAQVLSRDRGIWSPAFLPDSRRIIYFTTSSELVIVDVQGGKRRVVPVTLPLPAARESIAIAPDGRTIYYGAQRIESNVWQVRRQ
jgi:hypothetical protein